MATRMILYGVHANKEKTYSDIMIDWVKEYGILNLWEQYCANNRMHIRLKIEKKIVED